jgi:Flp pilus assembly protein CpaB
VGLVLAVVAFLGVFLVGSLLGGGAGGGGGAKVQIMVAAHDIPYRTTIGAADVVPVSYYQVDVPQGAYLVANKADLAGKIAELNITKGQPVTQNMLAVGSENVLTPTSAYLPLPSGWVAYTMPTSEQQGVAGYPEVGDYITVIASVDLSQFNTGGAQSGPSKFIVKTVFTNLRIIRIGPSTGAVTQVGGTAAGTSGGATATQGGLSSSLTVELTQCDAEYMTWLQARTTLRYTLESYHDYLAAPPSAPDSSCPTIQSAHGVGTQAVNARFQFTATQ